MRHPQRITGRIKTRRVDISVGRHVNAGANASTHI